MKTIERKSLLYKTGVEYGDYTANHVQGCAHGCRYPCYAMQMSKRFGKIKNYEEWCEPKLVENALNLLDKEIPKLRNKIRSVHLCFSTDPFMYGYTEVSEMSINIIKKLNANGIECSVLTKGILPFELAKLSKENKYGITVVSLSDKFRSQFEPNTANIQERIQALHQLHDKGCYTWVSIEPYPTPNIFEQSLDDILNAVSFVDKIIFGRMNYNKSVTEYKQYKVFYNECSEKVIAFCKECNIDCHIKVKTQNKKTKEEKKDE